MSFRAGAIPTVARWVQVAGPAGAAEDLRRVITVLGSINLDLIGRVARLPQPGETVPGSGFTTAPGGKGANQALAAARAGAAVTMIGAVGDDGFASEALALLSAGGVDLQRVRTAGAPTGIALILVDEEGENVIAVIPGANGTVTAGDVADLAFAAGDVLLLQLEVPVAAMQAAARRAQADGAQVLLNFAPFRDDAVALTPLATHLIVNETECALVAKALGIAGASVAEQAGGLARRNDMTVIVTLGKKGALAIADGDVQSVPALAVDAVDTVGAGDTFCGYLAAALAEAMPLGEALVLASTAAGLACTKPGAQPAIPERSDVAALLARDRTLAT
jgi:ribokinase